MSSQPPIMHFQTTLFRVAEINTFLQLPTVNRFIKEMENVDYYQESNNDYLSFGLPPRSFSSQFQDLGRSLDTDDIIELMTAIQDHIHPEDTCHINYVKHYSGERLTFCTMVISKGDTSGYCSACDAKNAFGGQNSRIIGGIA